MDQSALIPCLVFISGNFDSQLLAGYTGRIRKQCPSFDHLQPGCIGLYRLTDGLNQRLLPVYFT